MPLCLYTIPNHDIRPNHKFTSYLHLSSLMQNLLLKNHRHSNFSNNFNHLPLSPFPKPKCCLSTMIFGSISQPNLQSILGNCTRGRHMRSVPMPQKKILGLIF
ncbi:uncharacterized protein SPPG_09486 [Spizellomyces punctatus DAOM BR117]|uniref:Uncharacterized protein n=1 Tax=Spizellomyces punctatus (strain DAOM BR117) TaxID=645134 RepID=A0A0L0H8H0_SPIPD|nr:uncharacterized protein SPPG_09486 [Spizellomyces punctatus DAOM BR117]KNC97261.1 hypothetical protein SPPG_09486 [Spizellomyces punctatus DAOM BR117]|eukprot:XP_016605301.1 hypothetical protein SPPG_09486 [Spizellomyces punctatus DAOM BR117]